VGVSKLGDPNYFDVILEAADEARRALGRPR
jgi:hypothetical protein